MAARWRRLAPRAARLGWSYGAFLARLGREGLFAHYFTRSVEYPLAVAWLGPLFGRRVIDLGSGDGPFPLFLARQGAQALALDMDPAVGKAQWWADRWRRRGGRLPGALRSLVGDARAIPLADGTLDGALAVSSLEHVPGDGDSAAMAELGRVLRPGGRAFVSVEAAERYLEVQAGHGHTVGHEYGEARRQLVRYYDPAALNERLVAPSGLICEATWCFGERTGPLRARFDEPAFRARWYPLALPLARWRCGRLDSLDGLPRTAENQSNAVACLLLRKPC